VIPAEHIEIAIPDGSLAAAVHLPLRLPASVVVCCHGLLSSKDSAKFVRMGEEFSENGLAVVRFDFSGCGASRASLAESLLAGRMRDLRAVLDFVYNRPWSNGITGLLGSSFGGYLALLAASSDLERIKSVVCWAAPFDLEKITLPPGEPRALRKRFPPGFELGAPTSLEAMPPISGVLAIHGKLDETVPWQEALEIYHRARDPRRLLVMEKVEHRFLDPASRRLARRLSLEWFLEQGF
jgi:pimeloyl-ACP methyl ester carboxylesterase